MRLCNMFIQHCFSSASSGRSACSTFKIDNRYFERVKSYRLSLFGYMIVNPTCAKVYCSRKGFTHWMKQRSPLDVVAEAEVFKIALRLYVSVVLQESEGFPQGDIP